MIAQLKLEHIPFHAWRFELIVEWSLSKKCIIKEVTMKVNSQDDDYRKGH